MPCQDLKIQIGTLATTSDTKSQRSTLSRTYMDVASLPPVWHSIGSRCDQAAL